MSPRKGAAIKETDMKGKRQFKQDYGFNTSSRDFRRYIHQLRKEEKMERKHERNELSSTKNASLIAYLRETRDICRRFRIHDKFRVFSSEPIIDDEDDWDSLENEDIWYEE